MRISDWSSDVCSSDLEEEQRDAGADGKQDDTPIVKFVNKVLIDAIKRGASDIHFEPYETDYRVRLRIDGILKQSAKMPVKLNQRISARLKVMSQRSEEHTSELQSLMRISSAVLCLKKRTKTS